MAKGLLHRRRIMQASGGILPPEYMEIEAITESNGGYVTTGILYGYGAIIESKVLLPQGKFDMLGWGNYGGHHSAAQSQTVNGNRMMTTLISGDWTAWEGTFAPDVWHDVEIGILSNGIETSYYNVDGVRVATPPDLYLLYIPHPILLFNRSNRLDSGANNNPSIKRTKIYNYQRSLVADIIPCKRISDNVVGMYDIINQIFCPPTGQVQEYQPQPEE